MNQRPSPITFDDLATPCFSASANELLNGMASLGETVVLDAQSMMAEATDNVGLDDFGDDPGFAQRVGVYVDALREEGCLSGAGKLMAHSQVMQILSNRLLATNYVQAHPDVRSLEVARPIVIVGLPRTGTTHLHNLISADTNLRSLEYWESLEPVPSLAEQRLEIADGRRDRCAAGVWFINEVMPEFKRMHEMTVDHVHEEIQLLAIDCSTMLLETVARVPSWRNYYKTHDQQSSYDYMKLMLQVCQHQQPGAEPTRWVLKSPQHLEQIPAIMTTFPDATLVFTHRDPASVIASFVTMSAYTARIGRTAPIDLNEIGAYWCNRILDLYVAATRDRHLVAPSQSVDVHFDEFMRDDLATVERVYDIARQPFTATTRASMDRFIVDHPRGKFGGVEYDLEQFGLRANEIREAAASYIDAFNVTLEEQW